MTDTTDHPDATRLHALTLACAAYGVQGHAAVTEAAAAFERYLRPTPEPQIPATSEARRRVPLLPPAVPVDQSVRPDAVVCLECGARMQVLRRHLRTAHALDADAYRARWRLSKSHPLTAPDYSEKRSYIAMHNKLGGRTSPQSMRAVLPNGDPAP